MSKKWLFAFMAIAFFVSAGLSSCGDNDDAGDFEKNYQNILTKAGSGSIGLHNNGGTTGTSSSSKHKYTLEYWTKKYDICAADVESCYNTYLTFKSWKHKSSYEVEMMNDWLRLAHQNQNELRQIRSDARDDGWKLTASEWETKILWS